MTTVFRFLIYNTHVPIINFTILDSFRKKKPIGLGIKYWYVHYTNALLINGIFITPFQCLLLMTHFVLNVYVKSKLFKHTMVHAISHNNPFNTICTAIAKVIITIRCTDSINSTNYFLSRKVIVLWCNFVW